MISVKALRSTLTYFASSVARKKKKSSIYSHRMDDGRDGWEEDGTADSSKPRRLDESLVSYLISLEAQVNSSAVDAEAQEALIENVLLELKTCTASAACDRRTNVIVEKICMNTTLADTLELFRRFTDYSVFLARNRHSSHVLQALLAHLCVLLKDYHIGGAEEEDEFIEVFTAFAEPILKEISWLAKDMSASHVVRALWCVLTGIPVISERKGKNSKHQHAVPGSKTLESLQASAVKCFYISQEFTFHVPSSFHDLLRGSIEGLIALPTSELQDLVADQGSAALLGLGLRILMNPKLITDGPELGEKLIRKALNWSEEADDADETGAPIFYGMSADKAASYFLESILECGPIAFLLTICKYAVVGRGKEYAEDFTANFVLQAVLRRLSAIMQKTHSANITDKSDKSQEGDDDVLRIGGKRYKKVIEMCKTLLEELLPAETFFALVGKCAGVVLWMLDLAKAISGGEAFKAWGQKVAQALLNVWTNSGDKDCEVSELVTVFTKNFSPKKPASEVEPEGTGRERSGDAEELSGKKDKTTVKIQKPKFGAAVAAAAAAAETNKAHDSRQLLWARLTGAVLQLKETEAADSVCTALSQLPRECLFHMATSGPISRSVIDVLLDSADQDVLNAILETVQPLITQLASNFLGQHVIRRLFERCAVDDKIALANLLQCDLKILQKSKEGRASLKLCQIDLLSRQPEEWHRMIQRQQRGAEMISDLTSHVTASAETSGGQFHESNNFAVATAAAATNASTSGGWAVDSSSYSQGADKEKRKRKSSSSNSEYSSNDRGNSRRHHSNNKNSREGASRADYDKINRLKGSNLGLNLKSEVEAMQRERQK